MSECHRRCSWDDDDEPVCASNGVSYRNRCLFAVVNCGNPTIGLWHEGVCGDLTHVDCKRPCQDKRNPVCGSNARTYTNSCLLTNAQCDDPELQMNSEGPCESIEDRDTISGRQCTDTESSKMQQKQQEEQQQLLKSTPSSCWLSWRVGGWRVLRFVKRMWPLLLLIMFFHAGFVLREVANTPLTRIAKVASNENSRASAVVSAIKKIINAAAWTDLEGVTNQELAQLTGTVQEIGLSSFKPPCPATPPSLVGMLKVVQNVSVSEVEKAQAGRVRDGGRWWPEECQARWRLAVLVPYRNREQQIGPFLNHMHPILQRQQLNYSIYFIEQNGTELFNRARLLNVGFLEARKEGPWDCYAFHDIDMLPENDEHLYHCSAMPRHLTVSVSTNKYKDSSKMPYNTYFGGVCLMSEKHMLMVNGWSNVYWGWGGEDDDMWRRLAFMDMVVWRYPAWIARYTMVTHKPQIVNEKRFELLRNTGRFPNDGLNTLDYSSVNTNKPLYRHIMADIG
ncbi:hypothetical protein Pmani_018511, partial [Petrolisthes manimaculis]